MQRSKRKLSNSVYNKYNKHNNSHNCHNRDKNLRKSLIAYNLKFQTYWTYKIRYIRLSLMNKQLRLIVLLMSRFAKFHKVQNFH